MTTKEKLAWTLAGVIVIAIGVYVLKRLGATSGAGSATAPGPAAPSSAVEG